MGFGILFFAYFLALPTFANIFLSLPVASGLMVWACVKLSRVNRPFIRAFYAACALIPLSTTASILRLVTATEFIAPYFETACLIIWMILHVFLLTGIEWVAAETNLTKLRGKAFRNKIFSLIYLLPAICLTAMDGVPIPAGGAAFLRGFGIAIVVVGLVVMVLNLFAIYSAYMHICMPEDVTMPQKPSRFAFVNRRREEEERRERENSEALEAAKARRQAQKEAKRNANSGNRQKQRKKKK